MLQYCATADTISSDMFRSDIFTFKVGPDETPFHVHGDLVAAHSAALAAMMDNPYFKESSEKVAVLQEVDEQTFSRFMEFMYTGTYRLEPATYRSVTHSRIEEEYNQSLKEENMPIFGDRSHKSPCCDKYHDLNGDLCYSCGTVRPSEDLSKSFRGLTFSEERLTREALADYFDPFGSPSPFSEDLICHAKLYCFGQIYLIENLKDLCLFKLHHDLVNLCLEENVTEVVDLLAYVFHNTSSNDDATNETGSILRRLVIMYAAANQKELVTHRDFLDLLEQGGELVSVLARFVSKRLDQ